jgi:CRISPR-associated protein (TIGR02710 family)
MKSKSPAPDTTGGAHIVTMGKIPPTATSPSVLDALVKDLKSLKPAHVSVLATEDSKENAQKLLSALKLGGRNGRVLPLSSHLGLDEAYKTTAGEIARLGEAGYGPEEITLHYTAGTKVMSAGAVLAAVSANVVALRYLGGGGPGGGPSVPVLTAPQAVLAASTLRSATALFFDLQFSAAAEKARGIDPTLLSSAEQDQAALLVLLSEAYSHWDNFRAAEFIRLHERAAGLIPAKGPMARTRVSPATLARLGCITSADAAACQFPGELLEDIYNNALRRMAERRYDDALVRLYRCAELHAQKILATEYGLRTDNLDIRRVPPRSRAGFEAERRLDDATIKLGLRKSYELLEILGHPAGRQFFASKPMAAVLHARRNLVLAHGTTPSPAHMAIEFLDALRALISLTDSEFARRAASTQFPWLDNAVIEASLRRELGMDVVVPRPKGKKAPATEKSAPKKAAPAAKRKPAPRRKA